MSREVLFSLLGNRPVAHAENNRVIEKKVFKGMHVETLLLDLNGIEQVPAYFIKPIGAEGRLPAVLYNHSHGGNYEKGRNEVLQGNTYLQPVSFAKELTDLGYAVLAIDAWGFNERSGKKESELFKEMLITGKVMWGMMLYDSIHALDYLVTREDVDPERISTIGMSMGGFMSWWLGALDERVKVVIDISAQVDLETMIEKRLLDKHGFYSYVPNLLSSFTTSSIQSLIAPRHRLSLVGKDDSLCPISGVKKVSAHLEKTYRKMNKADHFKQVITSGGHQETAQMRLEWKTYIQKQL
ncbi:MAG: acetylxylan esterase [Alkalibacterium sp.]|nr:acetylxylan esterase [Alkalibacterium sp.]